MKNEIIKSPIFKNMLWRGLRDRLTKREPLDKRPISPTLPPSLFICVLRLYRPRTKLMKYVLGETLITRVLFFEEYYVLRVLRVPSLSGSSCIPLLLLPMRACCRAVGKKKKRKTFSHTLGIFYVIPYKPKKCEVLNFFFTPTFGITRRV